MSSIFRSALATFLATSLLLLGPASGARAGAVSTETLAASSPQFGISGRDALVGELVGLGVDPLEAQRRVAALSAEEVAAVQGRLDQLPAGGFVGEVVGAILIVFLVLLITDIAGLTNVFPWVNHPHRSASRR
jgi:hypothetical protein